MSFDVLRNNLKSMFPETAISGKYSIDFFSTAIHMKKPKSLSKQLTNIAIKKNYNLGGISHIR